MRILCSTSSVLFNNLGETKMANKPMAPMWWSELTKETITSHLEHQIELFSKPTTKDGDDCWDCFVDGKILALEQTLEFVKKLSVV